MSVLYYMLASQANLLYYALTKDERKTLTIRYAKKITNQSNDINIVGFHENKRTRNGITILLNGLDLINEFDKINFDTSKSIKPYRRELANKCRDLRRRIFIYINNEIKGMDYVSMSNLEYAELINQEILSYFFMASNMAENSNKLTEYMLKRE